MWTGYPPPKKTSFMVPSPPLRSKSRGSSVIISQKAIHRQFPSWLPPNIPFRVGETFCCPSLGTPDQIPGHSMHRKPFRRLTNLLGMSQETWAISWGIHVFTDGCMQSAVCVLFSETAQALSVLSELLRPVSKLALEKSYVCQAENGRKNETKNAVTLQWKVTLVQQFPLDVLHADSSFVSCYPLYSLEGVRMLVSIFLSRWCINQLWKSVLIHVWMCLVIVKCSLFFPTFLKIHNVS